MITLMLLITACKNPQVTDQQTTVPHNALTTAFTAHPKPRMWVDMYTSMRRVAYFAGTHAKLTRFINRPGMRELETVFCTESAFEKMIHYFDSVKYVWLDVIIADNNDRLTLLYRPVSRAGNLDYYMLPDNAVDFIPSDPTFHPGNTNAEKMIKEYLKTPPIISSKMKILKENLDKNDLENYEDHDRHNPFLNTKSIRYDSSSINEMIREVHYQDTANGNKVTGIKAMLAMIGPDGMERGLDSGLYKNRLLVLFEFTKRNSGGVEEIMYIDTTRNASDRSFGFMDRRQQDTVTLKEAGWTYISKGLDNGQLCPSSCPR